MTNIAKRHAGPGPILQQPVYQQHPRDHDRALALATGHAGEARAARRLAGGGSAMRQRWFAGRLRWTLPGGALVVAGAVLAGTMLACAAPPSLPRQTPPHLISTTR